MPWNAAQHDVTKGNTMQWNATQHNSTQRNTIQQEIKTTHVC